MNEEMVLVIKKSNIRKTFFGIPYKGNETVLVSRKEAIKMFSNSVMESSYPLIIIHPDIEVFNKKYNTGLAYVLYSYEKCNYSEKLFVDYAYNLIEKSNNNSNVAYLGKGIWGEAKHPGGKWLKDFEEIKKSIEIISRKNAISKIISTIENNIALYHGAIELAQEEQKGFFAIYCT